MKGFIILIILAVAGYFAYDHFLSARMSGPYKAYVEFADYMDQENFDRAVAMGTGNVGIHAAVEARRSWHKENRGPRGNLYIKESFRKIDYSDLGEGYASFTILQKSFTDPATTTPTDADYMITQEVEMETDSNDEWIITEYSETIESLK